MLLVLQKSVKYSPKIVNIVLKVGKLMDQFILCCCWDILLTSTDVNHQCKLYPVDIIEIRSKCAEMCQNISGWAAKNRTLVARTISSVYIFILIHIADTYRPNVTNGTWCADTICTHLITCRVFFFFFFLSSSKCSKAGNDKQSIGWEPLL